MIGLVLELTKIFTTSWDIPWFTKYKNPTVPSPSLIFAAIDMQFGSLAIFSTSCSFARSTIGIEFMIDYKKEKLALDLKFENLITNYNLHLALNCMIVSLAKSVLEKKWKSDRIEQNWDFDTENQVHPGIFYCLVVEQCFNVLIDKVRQAFSELQDQCVIHTYYDY